MKLLNTRSVALSLVLCLVVMGARSANIEEMVRDTQRLVIDEGQVSMVWWIPWQFWDESLAGNEMLSEQDRKQVIDVVDDYTILAVLRGTTDAQGLSSVQTRTQLLQNTQVVANGKQIEALQREEIKTGALTMLSQLRPALVAAAGPMGEGLEFLVYPGAEDGTPLVDAAKAGTLEVSFYSGKYLWRLPLGSMLPARVDPATGETFPGDYRFNPYTGGKLQEN